MELNILQCCQESCNLIKTFISVFNGKVQDSNSPSPIELHTHTNPLKFKAHFCIKNFYCKT